MASYSQRFRDAFVKELSSWNQFSDYSIQFLASLALAQAKLESANFTSSLFVKYNNCIGYTAYSGSSWQIGSAGDQPEEPGLNPYGVYKSIEYCAYELADYVHRRFYLFKNVHTVVEYATVLKNEKYYTASLNDYIHGMEVYFVPPVGDFSDQQPFFLEALGAEISRPPLIYWALGILVTYCVVFYGWSLKRIFLRK